MKNKEADKNGSLIREGYKGEIRKFLMNRNLNKEGCDSVIEYINALIEELNILGLPIRFPRLKKKSFPKKREKEIGLFINLIRTPKKKLHRISISFDESSKPLKFSDPFIIDYLNRAITQYKSKIFEKNSLPIEQLAIMELENEFFYSYRIRMLQYIISLFYKIDLQDVKERHINITTYAVLQICDMLPEEVDENKINAFIESHVNNYTPRKMSFKSDKMSALFTLYFSFNHKFGK